MKQQHDVPRPLERVAPVHAAPTVQNQDRSGRARPFETVAVRLLRPELPPICAFQHQWNRHGDVERRAVQMPVLTGAAAGMPQEGVQEPAAGPAQHRPDPRRELFTEPLSDLRIRAPDPPR